MGDRGVILTQSTLTSCSGPPIPELGSLSCGTAKLASVTPAVPHPFQSASACGVQKPEVSLKSVGRLWEAGVLWGHPQKQGALSGF